MFVKRPVSWLVFGIAPFSALDSQFCLYSRQDFDGIVLNTGLRATILTYYEFGGLVILAP
jgi:hypothetical protein